MPMNPLLVTNIKPMLASPPKKEVLSTLVGTHAFDIKLDGVRVILYWTGALCRLVNRSGVDVTAQYPEVVASAAAQLGTKAVILDGEVVASSGSFQDTAKRAKQNKALDIKAAMATIPVVFIAFDVLLVSDLDVRGMPWDERRTLLDAMLSTTLGPGGCIAASIWTEDPGFFDAVKKLGMEGVIAKRKDAPYRSGRFSDWIKFKAVRSITCLGIGYEPGTGARAHFGAMFLALVSEKADIVEVGRVGTGFDNAEILMLKNEMDAGRVVVVEIECLNKSKDGKLRFPVYKGIRNDMSVVDATLAQLDDIPTM